MSGVGKGRVHVYTGDGKGKTTAALGLALRAAGAGLKVSIIQFLKGLRCSEHEALERFSDLVDVRQFGREGFIVGEPTAEDRRQAQQAFAHARTTLERGEHDVVVLDEACIAIHYGLLSVKELLDALKSKREGVEVIITGRRAPEELLEGADLVTEMREVKHYSAEGLKARRGIEY